MNLISVMKFLLDQMYMVKLISTMNKLLKTHPQVTPKCTAQILLFHSSGDVMEISVVFYLSIDLVSDVSHKTA